MEIQSGISVSTISLTNLIRAASGSGKVSFPVSPQNLAFANFKNIKTFPSNSEGEYYSVSRLRALDNLIEQLKRMNGKPNIEVPKIASLDNGSLDSIISKLSGEIHAKLGSVPVFRAPIKSTGLLFNMII